MATEAEYTADGAALARTLLPALGWSPDRVELCAEAIDRHHDVRRQLSRGAEVEALRLADLIDVSGGLLRFGLDRGLAAPARRGGPAARAVPRDRPGGRPRRARASADAAADLLAGG